MMTQWKLSPKIAFPAAMCLLSGMVAAEATTSYSIVETGQQTCYDSIQSIVCPQAGEPFYGQDAQYQGNPFSFQDNGDGTISDLVTGLMWQQTPDLNNKSTFAEAVAEVDTFSLAGYNDWRLPTVKELYSLIDFNGSSFALIPYIDTNYFAFVFGDTAQGERAIDAQYWSSTQYVGLTMGGDATVFGVNFADGRIKGYPRDTGPFGQPFTEFVRYVRGNTDYGVNEFVDNGDGTVTDQATGLMWQKSDDGVALNWEDALAYAEGLSLAGHNDWRLPNTKELQSIVDYTHAPDASDPSMVGPAIDTVFGITNIGTVLEPDYDFFWAGTTHLDAPTPDAATYFCFGEGWGWMEQPPGSGNYVHMNVHGAGAQRSDPKSGDPGDWPHGNGPQGDDIRIFNSVRAVRTTIASQCCVGTRGDINGDGVDLDIVDVSCIVDFLFGTGCNQPCAEEADPNGDSSVSDIVDLTFVVDFLFGVTPTLVACP